MDKLFMRKGFCDAAEKGYKRRFILFLSWQAKSVCVMLEAFICFYAGQ